MSDRALQILPGYGASLRSQLAAVGWSQSKLAAKSGVNRQTISRAINHDTLSKRTEKKLAAALGRAPAERTRSARPGARSPAPIPGKALCDASDLVDWAGRRESQSLLPLLIRRLVRATATRVTEFNIRTDEGVHLPGWDGIVQNEQATPFVPEGTSGWEMSVATGPQGKAERDYRKRAEDSRPLVAEEATLVFVTLRRWGGKDVWAAEKSESGPWLRVKVLDADDLAAWLEEAPAVHTWLSILIGKIPRGTNDLEAYWNEWSGGTRPTLTPELVLSGRAEAVAEIHRRLTDIGGQAVAICAEAREEAIAWLYCVIQDLPPERAEGILARCLVVESPEALRRLTGAHTPLVLVPTFDPQELASAATRTGHAVVIPSDDAGPIQGDDVIRIPPVSRQSVAGALEQSGIENDRAYQMAGLAVRSLTAFRRTIARSPAFRTPGWSQPGVARGLVPALLAGSWNDANPEDRETLSRLGSGPYEEVVEVLLEWSVGSDPMVRRKQDAWYLVSPEDAWQLMRRYVLRHDLERFEDTAFTVLGRVDPAFDLPPDQRWMAGALGHTPEHSRILRGGLARTLAIMGVHGAELPSPTFSARDASAVIVRKLLERANADWRLWGSLSARLSLLAEGAPDCFLEAVEEGLREPDPVLGKLFDSAGDPVFGSHLHTGLLQALEVLAWSPDHLGRVVSLLARLDLVDQGSELSPKKGSRSRSVHRPLRVLKAIFRSWLPETSATLKDRLDVLDMLRKCHGSAAWHVMISMLPELNAVGIPASRPLVRDWAVDAGRALTRNERARTIAEVVVRLLEDAGSSGRRWAGVLGRLHMLPGREHDLVVAALKRLDPAELGGETRTAIWEALRGIVTRHRAHRTARWAMPEEYVVRLEGIRERFAPDDPVALYGWLFTSRPPQVDIGDRGRVPWEVRRQWISDERAKAALAILERAGLQGLTKTARAVDNPFELGFAAAGSPSALLNPDDLLLRHLADPDQALCQMAAGYATGRAHADGDAWVARQLARDDLRLTADQRVELLLVLPDSASTWRVATTCGEDIAGEYWRRVTPRYVEDEDLTEAIVGLVRAQRPFVAADLIAFDERVTEGMVPPELMAKLLDAAASVTGGCDAPGPDFASSAGFLLDTLQNADYDQTVMARLEWRLMPALSHHERSPDALHQLMAEDPEFFLEVLSLVFPAEGEEPSEVSQQDRIRATSGYSVLESWRTIPGRENHGGVDGVRLRRWMECAILALERAGRVKIGHRMIGQMLSGGLQDRDGTWPCEPIRQLIEELRSRHLEQGFCRGVYNSCGVVMKDPSAGGASERALAERYEGFAAAIRGACPRTAGMLRDIGALYRRDASREDFESEMVEAMDMDGLET